MKNEKHFSVADRGRSFRFALDGIIAFFRNEHNALLHLLATVALVALVIFYPVSRTELVALIIVAGIVWMAELFNTAIEKLVDFVSVERHPSIKFIKDVSAAAVLVAALAALATGAIIFIPKIFSL